MRQLREVLGPDAVILSNRAVDGGVEVLALAAEDIASMAPPVSGGRPRRLAIWRVASAGQQRPSREPEVTIKRRLIERVAVPSEDSAQLAKSVISEIKTHADACWRVSSPTWPGATCRGATRRVPA